MRKQTREDGYILASAIGSLLAISIVAAALVGASSNALAASKRAEADAAQSSILRSALLVVGTQLVLEPRRRQIDLEGQAIFPVLGQQVTARINWETRKLDINLAEPSVIGAFLQDRGIDASIRNDATAAVARRVSGAPARLMSDLGLERSIEDCLATYLTVFGGSTDFDPAAVQEEIQIGRPAAGARLTVDLAIVGHEQEGLSAVILVTRTPATPFKILDWRPTSRLAGDPCDVS